MTSCSEHASTGVQLLYRKNASSSLRGRENRMYKAYGNLRGDVSRGGYLWSLMLIDC